MDSVRTIGVVGAGQMGNGIAHVAALAGFDVVLRDVAQAALDRGMVTLRANLDRQVSKGKVAEGDAAAALARITSTTDPAALAGCDLLIEAATEDPSLKQRIFGELDAIAGPEAILATNTSSISVTGLAAHTSRPDRVIGMHFMNPVPVMTLVEVIRGLATSDATHAAVVAVAQAMGKTVVDSRDMPGFIVNRVLMPYINEAFYVLHEGIASAEDIDAAMKLGTNVPMGPLTLADFIGLDTCLAIMEVLHHGFGGDSKYRPCPLLRKHVEAGWLGRKTGRGVYMYAR